MLRVLTADVRTATSDYYGMPIPELISGKGRMRKVRARWAGMYVSRELTSASLPQIATTFGRKDHTTVLWGLRKVQAALDRNSETAAVVIASIRDAALQIALRRQVFHMPRLTYQAPEGDAHAAHH